MYKENVYSVSAEPEGRSEETYAEKKKKNAEKQTSPGYEEIKAVLLSLIEEGELDDLIRSDPQ
jgi:hypothetical protein